jgi:hypothetical protein
VAARREEHNGARRARSPLPAYFRSRDQLNIQLESSRSRCALRCWCVSGRAAAAGAMAVGGPLAIFTTLLLLSAATPATPFSQFDLGTSCAFDYTSTVLFNEARSSLQPGADTKDVGFQIAATLQVAALWQHPANANDKILQLTVRQVFFTNK